MALDLIIVLFLIGFIGSFISGMVGIGGSVIKYPLLLYVPPLLGVGLFTAAEVAGLSAIQVFFATIGGVWAFRKGGYLNKSLILTMGISVLVGSFIGGFGSRFVADDMINLIYGVMAVLATIMMFLPQKRVEETVSGKIDFNRPIAITSAFIIGVSAGIVGAGGAFLLVPIMLVILKIPTRVTIASSLAITFLSSIGSTIGKVVTGQILYAPAIVLIVASLIAAPLGANAGKKMNTKILQSILSILILVTAIKIWFDIIG
ncbi:MAG TPA: sulfite exporter TauE/SafE family protein [Virgibacillus sp.]|nr:sulfite exporter TauE/SafE family protein [Virgibacillus sp.]